MFESPGWQGDREAKPSQVLCPGCSDAPYRQGTHRKLRWVPLRPLACPGWLRSFAAGLFDGVWDGGLPWSGIDLQSRFGPLSEDGMGRNIPVSVIFEIPIEPGAWTLAMRFARRRPTGGRRLRRISEMSSWAGHCAWPIWTWSTPSSTSCDCP